MENIYNEVDTLDQRCYEEFGLKPEILMEHAANSIAIYIKNNFKKNSSVLIVSGSGNNGADGIALARILHKQYDVKLYLISTPKTAIGLYQLEVASKIGVNIVNKLSKSDVVVDAILGSGFKGELKQNYKDIIFNINSFDSYKIACDIPTGLAFKADITFSMGGYKTILFEDFAKDFVGDIRVVDLGISRQIYQKDSKKKLLSFDDIKFPTRMKKTVHKGDFGHLAVISGQKNGAAVISGLSGFNIGAGLVSLIGQNNNIPYILMQSQELPDNTTAIIAGMGLGSEIDDKFLNNNIAKLMDADIFYSSKLLHILELDNIVLTPHPKEFVNMYNMIFDDKIDIKTLQKDRFLFVKKISKYFPNVVFLLKGANVLIAYNEMIFVNPFGENNLAKGGSGDVLSGIIGGLLAQGYDRLDAAISGSLIHSKISNMYSKANFSLTPNDLIDGIKQLCD